MRTVLGLLGLLWLAATTAAAVSVSARQDRGTTILTFRGDAVSGLYGPVMRLVPIASDAGLPSAGIVEEEAGAYTVQTGSPMVLRGVRFLPVTVTPSERAGKSASRAGTEEVHVAIRGAALTEEIPTLPRAFVEALGGIVPQELMPRTSEEPGAYLIITDPALAGAVAPLAQWKRERGFSVTVVTTQVTGIELGQIHQYIIDRYHDVDAPPLEYVLLMGDVEQIPGFDFHATVSDHPYALLDGDDFLPEVFVGRLPAFNLPEAETMIAKTLSHERDLYLDEGTDWFERGLVVAADYGSTTPVPVSRWCRDQMRASGFTQVDSVFYPPHYGTGRILIPRAINAGVSLVTYRGWAYGIHGWEPPSFIDSDVYGLLNGRKLPVVMSFVCDNNAYSTDPECFGEAWLRAGSAAEPKGAVAFVGNSEPWSHTRFNDGMAAGTFDAFGSRGVRGLAPILLAGKLNLLEQFPTEIPFSGDGSESVEFYFHIYNILGDPELTLWAGAPRAIQVSHPATLSIGSNFIEARVTTDDGVTPISGVRIGVAQGETSLGSAWTDETGIAHVPISLESEGNLTVAATGANVRPYRGILAIASGAPFLSVETVTIDDDTQGASLGNGDGVPNPGETVELSIRLRNRGSDPTTSATATLSNQAGVALTVLDASAAYPPMAAGAEADPLDPFVVRIDARAENALRALLRVHADTGGEVSVSDLALALVAPALRFESAAVLSLEGDEILPGQTVDVSVVLKNDGPTATAGGTLALLDRSGGLVTLDDATAALGPVAPGASTAASDPFRFTVDPEAAIGQGLDFTLECTTAEGPICVSSFSLMVGTPEHDAPLGPDGYGYYAYDNSDTDYPDTAPLYEWTPCSTVYGGDGTKLTLGDNEVVVVDLPFSFRYYGQAYDRIAVSDNGWISFDLGSPYDFYNWHMPNSYGNATQIAPFWDNLDPEKNIDGRLLGDGVYVLHDAVNHRFLVEWSRLPNQRVEFDDLQTFQAILYDPASYATPTGDGIVQFQYKQITNNDKLRMHATVGIEDQTETIGLEYTYSSLYPPAAAPLSAGLAIRFTTQPPRYVPFRMASFEAARQGGALRLAWAPADDRPTLGTRIYRERDGRRLLLTPAPLAAQVRSYLDSGASVEAPAVYWIGSIDPVGREKLLGPFRYEPRSGIPAVVELAPRTANPFRGNLEIAYALPARGPVAMQVHDLAGRRVRQLVQGTVEAGRWTAVWDGRDDAGHEQPSGVYLCTLIANGKEVSFKAILLR